MNHYTKIQAENCIIRRLDKVTEDGVYLHHVIAIEDNNKFTHKWEEVLSESPTQKEIQTSILNYLQSIEKAPKDPVVVTDKDTEALGKKVKDL